MAMFLTILLWSVLVLAVSAAVFGKATRDAPRQDLRPSIEPGLDAPRFFASPTGPRPAVPEIPADALLRQIEHHIRVEQAAVESFLSVPTVEALRSKSSSPLMN